MEGIDTGEKDTSVRLDAVNARLDTLQEEILALRKDNAEVVRSSIVAAIPQLAEIQNRQSLVFIKDINDAVHEMLLLRDSILQTVSEQCDAFYAMMAAAKNEALQCIADEATTSRAATTLADALSKCQDVSSNFTKLSSLSDSVDLKLRSLLEILDLVPMRVQSAVADKETPLDGFTAMREVSEVLKNVAVATTACGRPPHATVPSTSKRSRWT